MSQIYIFLLLAIAARVAIGSALKQKMWPWIVSYWIVLTCKNWFDFISNGGL